MRAWLAAAALAALLASSPVRAAELPVDLELVLAVDISGSIDREEAALQRQGYLAALVDREVLRAIGLGMLGRIAISYMEWAGDGNQHLVVDWAVIHDLASARAFAERLAAAPFQTGRWTSIAGAIDFAQPLFAGNGFEGTRRVIDISGDGPNNHGPSVIASRDRAVAAGIVINGLPIINDRPSPGGFPSLKDLDKYYIGCVIGGPGAFIVVAEDFHAFAAAVRRKLILEISGLPVQETGPPSVWPAAAGPGYPGGCDVGERQMRDYYRSRPSGPD